MKKRILCFGDSNTWGYIGGTGERYDEDTRWTCRLQRLLGDDFVVIEEGHNGRTTVWDDPVENRLAGLTYLWPCMDSQSPFDLIIIMVGSNDTKVYFNVNARSIAESAGRLVDLAASSDFGPGRSHPKVLLVSPPRIYYNETIAHAFGQQAADKSAKFADEYRAVAREKGCFFMDAAAFAEPGEVDGLHLSAGSHERLAQAFYEKIMEILG